MAWVLGIPQLVILTGVSGVSINFGRDNEEKIGRIGVTALRALQDGGHFPAGSMGPKVEAALRFVENGGLRAIITGLEEAVPALAGETGTHVVPDEAL